MLGTNSATPAPSSESVIPEIRALMSRNDASRLSAVTTPSHQSTSPTKSASTPLSTDRSSNDDNSKAYQFWILID